jgi:hypothetical protein
MISCLPNDLANNAKALYGMQPQHLLASEVALLCSIAGVNCDPNTLSNLAKCLFCIDPNRLLAIAVMLLCDLVNNGGGGGGSPCLDFSTSPPVAPPDPTKCTAAIVVGYGDWVGFFWVWDDGFTNAWVQVPGGP